MLKFYIINFFAISRKQIMCFKISFYNCKLIYTNKNIQVYLLFTGTGHRQFSPQSQRKGKRGHEKKRSLTLEAKNKIRKKLQIQLNFKYQLR